MFMRSMRARLATATDTMPRVEDRLVEALALGGGQLLGIVEPLRDSAVSAKTTAATTTGPASGPRPASSTPATSCAPRRCARRS